MKKKICIIGGSIAALSSIIVEGYFIRHYKKEYYKVLRMWDDERSTKERKIKETEELKIKLDTLNDKYNNNLKVIVNRIYGVKDSEKEGEKENV